MGRKELCRWFARGHFGQARYLRKQGKVAEADAEQAEGERWRDKARKAGC